MKPEKESDFTFLSIGKESIRDRVKSLFKERSLRRVSQDWDIPYSTLNNYFSREATPSVDVLVRIAEIEGVSLEWLATGRESLLVVDEAHSSQLHETREPQTNPDQPPVSFGFTATPVNDEQFMNLTWSMFFNVLNKSEKQELIDIFSKFGTKGVLEVLRSDRDSNIEWGSLTQAEREQLLRLHKQLKKGSSESDSGVADADLLSNGKKAG